MFLKRMIAAAFLTVLLGLSLWAAEAPQEYKSYSTKLRMMLAGGKKIKPTDLQKFWAVNPGSYIGPDSYYGRLMGTVDPEYVRRNPVDAMYKNGEPSESLETAKLFAKLIGALEKAKVDYSANKQLKEIGEMFGGAYASTDMMRQMGVEEKNKALLELAILKLQLLSGYLDADAKLLEAKKELASVTEKVKTQEEVSAMKAEQARLKNEERIKAEKEHEEAIRQENLKVEEAKAEAERAKLAQARAEKMAQEIEELTERNMAQMAQYTKEQKEALIAEKEAELKAYEARERQRIATEIADEEARREAEAVLSKREQAMRQRISSFRIQLEAELPPAGTSSTKVGNVEGKVTVQEGGSVTSSYKADGVSAKSTINEDGSGEAEYEVDGQKFKIKVGADGKVEYESK